jgi:hypothetical protein
MKRLLKGYILLFITISVAIVIIPLVHAENKIVCISDNGKLNAGFEPQAYYFKGKNEGIYVVY